MSTDRRFEIPELFPQPKFVEMGEGISDLAVDVRLATTNVFPIQRKALRSILTMAGVRVVANKKKYVVDARVTSPEEDPAAFDLSAVPEELRHDYYEIRIQGSEVFLHTPYQEGIVWAAQTLATLFKMMLNGLAVPNLLIRDWCAMPRRGTLMRCNWSTAYMPKTDWLHAIDVFSQAKLNLLGIGIYGCRNDVSVSRNGKTEEFLMFPRSLQPAPSDPRTTVHERYYSAKFDRWYDCDIAPQMYSNDFLPEVITYAHERGMMIYPYFEYSADNSALPRMLPALSARNSKGKATGNGLCLSSPEAAEALRDFLGSFLDKYYPTGVEYFHLSMPGFADSKVTCQCAACKKNSRNPAALLLSFQKNILPFLLNKQVCCVIVDAVDFGNDAKTVKTAVQSLLKSSPVLAGKIALNWRCEKGGMTPVAIPGVAAWSTVVGNMNSFDNLKDSRKDLDGVCAAAFKNKGIQAVLFDSEFDQCCIGNYALLGVRCWENPDWKNDSAEAIEQRGEELRWQAAFPAVSNARKILRECVIDSAYLKILPMQSCIADAKGHYPAYPECVLKALSSTPSAVTALQKVSEKSKKAAESLREFLDNENNHWSDNSLLAIQNLFARLIQVHALCALISGLCQLYSNVKKKTAAARLIEHCTALHDELVANILDLEANLQDGMIPIVMQHFGCMKILLEMLADDFKCKSKNKVISWALPEGWIPPEDK